jgi:hypothetical protein
MRFLTWVGSHVDQDVGVWKKRSPIRLVAPVAQRRIVDRHALAVVHAYCQLLACGKRHSFLSVSLCVSRACLGKLIVFSNE